MLHYPGNHGCQQNTPSLHCQYPREDKLTKKLVHILTWFIFWVFLGPVSSSLHLSTSRPEAGVWMALFFSPLIYEAMLKNKKLKL